MVDVDLGRGRSLSLHGKNCPISVFFSPAEKAVSTAYFSTYSRVKAGKIGP